MPSARVSVVVPNYNHARYLRSRIDSILNQSFRDFDLLILDDRSTDDSVSVIESYRDHPKVSIALNEANSGNTFIQWRKGLAQTRSDYVWIAESDDCAAPTFLETMVARLDAHPTAGMAVSDSQIIDSDGSLLAASYIDAHRKIRQFRYYDFDALAQDGFHAGHDYLRRFMVPFNTAPNASAILFRRAALEGRLDGLEQLRLCGDWLVYCRILMDHDLYRVGAALNMFRQHANNVRSKTNLVDFLRQQRAVRDYVTSGLGPVEDANAQKMALDFESNLLLQSRRAPGNGRVPLTQIPAILRDSAEFGSPLALAALKLVAREHAASWLRPLRGKGALN